MLNLRDETYDCGKSIICISGSKQQVQNIICEIKNNLPSEVYAIGYVLNCVKLWRANKPYQMLLILPWSLDMENQVLKLDKHYNIILWKEKGKTLSINTLKR